MKIKPLKEISGFETNKRLGKRYLTFKKLISLLEKKELSPEVIEKINLSLDEINQHPNKDRSLSKVIGKNQRNILKVLEKEFKIVPKNYYRNMWMALGMAAFGIPMGAAFGAAMGNMAFLGIGIPIGMGVGLALGASMDQKAADEGRQLDVEISM